MKCPYCQATMDYLDHGKCPDCNKHCGCSFSPSSMSDYCGTHRPRAANAEFCVHCGAGIGKFRREGEGTCPKCNPEGVKKNEALAGRHQKPR